MKRLYAWLPLIAALYLVAVAHLVYFEVLAFVDMTYLVLSAVSMALIIGGWYLTVYVRIHLDRFFKWPSQRPTANSQSPLDPLNWQEDE